MPSEYDANFKFLLTYYVEAFENLDDIRIWAHKGENLFIIILNPRP